MAAYADFFKRQQMRLVCQDQSCSVYKMENETGDGTATVYDVFPGVFVMYNDFHLEKCPARQLDKTQMIAIHHCREGRIEWEVGDGNFLYLSSGDVMIDSAAVRAKNCSFPGAHYHGITISISSDKVNKDTLTMFNAFSVDIQVLAEQMRRKKHPFVIHGNEAFDHIVSELYKVPEEIKLSYLRIKVIELLLYLRTLRPEKDGEERPYFYRSQVEKIKAIHELMTENPEERFTMEELADRFGLSVSALKSCFKGVYGEAIYTYMRHYRLDLAASLLASSNLSVTEIAGKAGYSNVSKFSEAFRKVKGENPLDYRKSKN